MIQVYKIVSVKYNSVITPILLRHTHKTRGNNLQLQTLILNMTYVSFSLLTGLLTTGIVWIVTAKNT